MFNGNPNCFVSYESKITTFVSFEKDNLISNTTFWAKNEDIVCPSYKSCKESWSSSVISLHDTSKYLQIMKKKLYSQFNLNIVNVLFR